MSSYYQPQDFAHLTEGDPDALSGRAAGLSTQAQAIQDASNLLHDIASGQMSQATQELESTATEIMTSLLEAYHRYDGTADALKTYAVELSPLKSKAESDIAAFEAAKIRLGDAESAEYAAREQQQRDLWTEDDSSKLAESAQDLADASRNVANVEAEINEIVRRLQNTDAAKEEAASKAIAAIENVIKEGKDSILDNIAQFFEGVGNILANIARWAVDFIAEVISRIDVLWHALMVKVFAAIVLGLAAALLGGILGLVGGILFGPVGFLGGFLLGTGIVTIVTSVIVGRMLSDVWAGDPDVEMEVYEPDRESSLENAFIEATEVDDANNVPGAPDDAGTIRIEEVLGEDGVTRYRVVLPSTQDWQALAKFMSDDDQQTILQLLQDSGASNDVDSNLALMLMPEFQTIYERAVFEAMDQAGIDPGPNGDPVMLVGFSQGGIMAAHLAANRAGSYNFDAVLAAGSPIDHLTELMPSDTQVYSIQHESDPVPLTDGLIGEGVGELFGWYNGQRDTPTWDSIHATAYDGDQTVTGAAAHNSDLYNQSWQDYLDSGGLSPEERAELELFFASGNTSEGTTHHTWSE